MLYYYIIINIIMIIALTFEQAANHSLCIQLLSSLILYQTESRLF